MQQKICDICYTPKNVFTSNRRIGESYDGHRWEPENVQLDLCEKCKNRANIWAENISNSHDDSTKLNFTKEQAVDMIYQMINSGIIDFICRMKQGK